MAETTKIQWADATWNPWIGCTKVSAGCKNCYAENTTRARVLRGQGHETWGKGAKRDRTSAAYWKQPLKWQRRAGPRKRVFPSLCDWLDDEVPIEWLADFLKLIYETPNVDWLLLTKRPENFRTRLNAALDSAAFGVWSVGKEFAGFIYDWLEGNAPNNVWVGTSVENQEMADERIPELLNIPAKVRFLSAEPLLGPIDLKLNNQTKHDSYMARWSGLHWVIAGGESGADARPCNLKWMLDIVRQCEATGVPCFVKQCGSNAVYRQSGSFVSEVSESVAGAIASQPIEPMNFKHPKGGDIAEWPVGLQVRRFPAFCNG